LIERDFKPDPEAVALNTWPLLRVLIAGELSLTLRVVEDPAARLNEAEPIVLVLLLILAVRLSFPEHRPTELHESLIDALPALTVPVAARVAIPL
jgi:hypothetical protein